MNTAAETALLRQFWYVAATSASLDAGPVAVTILEEPLVITRLGGTAVAAADRCPHRGAPLSGGWLVDEPAGQCLVCPYHGLHFDQAGSAVRLPARGDEKLGDRLSLDLLPCREDNGLVWVSLDPTPVGDPPTWHSFDDPDEARFQLKPEIWDVVPTRIIENFNDIAHLGIVHTATFGVAVPGDIPRETMQVNDGRTEVIHVVALPQLDRQTADGPAEVVHADYVYHHYMPFSTELLINFDEHRSEWIQISVTPISARSSLVFQQNIRNFEIDGDIEGWAKFQHAVNTEDRVLVETLRPKLIGLDGSDSGEVALSVDGFTVAYRNIWRSLLRC